MIEHLPQPSPAELDALTALWEASVRATHDFLSEEDIPFFRQMVRNEALPGTTLYVIRESEAGTNRSGDACGSGGAYAGAETYILLGDFKRLLDGVDGARKEHVDRKSVV